MTSEDIPLLPQYELPITSSPSLDLGRASAYTRNPSRTSIHGAYLPLPGHYSIRLLDLDGDLDPNSNAMVTGTLRIVNLKRKPVFIALSYVWGDYSSPKDTILCNGHRIEVTRNCLDALRQIRTQGSVAIWVDAICINQQDNAEKSRQISFMARIYSRAQTVYFWLGEGNSKTDGAMDYLASGGLPFNRLIRDRIQDEMSIGKGVPTGKPMAMRLALHLYFRAITCRLRPHYTGLDEILGSRWISRLWTLQEALLPENIVVVCGRKRVPWNAILYSLKYMEFFRAKGIFSLIFPVANQKWQGLLRSRESYHLLDCRPCRHRPGRAERRRFLKEELDNHERFLAQGWKWFKVLIKCHYGIMVPPTIGIYYFLLVIVPTGGADRFKTGLIVGAVCWLPLLVLMSFVVSLRVSSLKKSQKFYPYSNQDALMIDILERGASMDQDKYYAVASFLGFRSLKMPEYSRENLELAYTTLFMELLDFSLVLDILLLASVNTRMPSAPSWVVDWRSARKCWINAKYYESRELRDNAWYPWLRRFKVLQPLSWLGFDIKERKLSPFKFYEYLGATPIAYAKWEVRNQENIKEAQLVTEGESIGRIIWVSDRFVPIAETSSQADLRRNVNIYQIAFAVGIPRGLSRMMSTKRQTSNYNEACCQFHEFIDGGLREGADWTVEKLRKSQRRPWKLFRGNSTTAWDVYLDMTNYMAQEDLVLTRYSDEFGVTSRGVTVGDVVALIKGVSLPMVLREREGGYEVISPAFFSSMMWQEAWRTLDPENLSEIILI